MAPRKGTGSQRGAMEFSGSYRFACEISYHDSPILSSIFPSSGVSWRHFGRIDEIYHGTISYFSIVSPQVSAHESKSHRILVWQTPRPTMDSMGSELNFNKKGFITLEGFSCTGALHHLRKEGGGLACLAATLRAFSSER